MVEAGLEDRRRPAVVLGGAEDDDRVRRPAVVVVADVDDPPGRPADDRDRADDPDADDAEERPLHAGNEAARPGARPDQGAGDSRRSTAVALLVLLAGPAPARIVPSDPGAGRREPGLRLAVRRSAPLPPSSRADAIGSEATPLTTGPDGRGPRAGRGAVAVPAPAGRRTGDRRDAGLGRGRGEPRGTLGETALEVDLLGRRLAGHGDPEDRRRDLVADQLAELARRARRPRGGTR